MCRVCVWGVLNKPSDDWRGDDISEHHEGLASVSCHAAIDV